MFLYLFTRKERGQYDDSVVEAVVAASSPRTARKILAKETYTTVEEWEQNNAYCTRIGTPLTDMAEVVLTASGSA